MPHKNIDIEPTNGLNIIAPFIWAMLSNEHPSRVPNNTVVDNILLRLLEAEKGFAPNDTESNDPSA